YHMYDLSQSAVNGSWYHVYDLSQSAVGLNSRCQSSASQSRKLTYVILSPMTHFRLVSKSSQGPINSSSFSEYDSRL
ncbi:hypothetical protein V5799_026879, partial [Amblyomma americanum]